MGGIMHKSRLSILIVITLLLLGTGLMAEDRLFRFPDISSDKIVFSYAGDLWTVPISGGLARRITSDRGLELFAKFSPDGQSIAFTGQYDGNTHVYFMPTEGGEPVRLTYHPAVANIAERFGPEHVVMDWTEDGQKILFRSRRDVLDVWSGKLMLADIKGGMPQELPVPDAGFASFSPDQTKIAYCPIYRDFRTWKRYMGGMAQDVYIYDLKTFDQERLTDWRGTDNMPMWAGDKIFFNSDRTGTLNLYAYDIPTKQTRQVTTFDDFDVRWPSLGPGHIVFENGGFLYLLDLNTEEYNKVSISLGSEKNLIRPEYAKVSGLVRDVELAPDAKRALFSARGEIFTVPAEHGNTRNLTQTSGVHEKEPVWSPDGRSIAYISDRSGEDEIYLMAQDGEHPAKQLTDDRRGYLYNLIWSPDSKKLAYADAQTNLYILDAASREVTTVETDNRNNIREFSWSPDARWLVYTRYPDQTYISTIYLYSVENNENYRVTSGVTNDYSPVFSRDGHYLFFLSDRNYNAALGGYEFNFIYNGMTGIYMMLLAEDTPSPFAPLSDEVEIASDKKPEKDKKAGDDKADKDVKAVLTKIDIPGLEQRELAIPIEPGNYSGLGCVGDRIYYFSNPYGGLSGRKGTQDRELRYYDIKEKKDNLFLTKAGNYCLSADGKSIMFSAGGSYIINDALAPAADQSTGRLNLDNMEMYLDRSQEYVQMFDETWRRYRDFFYDSLMHGTDWKAIHDRYAQLVPYAAHRYDLYYILGEMVGELSCSHTYIQGGDYYKPPSDKMALLGTDFTADQASGLYRFGKIYQGKNWEEALRAPLTEPGVEVQQGEYLFEVDGEKLTTAVNPYKLFVNKSDRIITLKVGPTEDIKAAREVKVRPIGDEQSLWYYDWVERRRAIVDSLSDGKIGYIHIPDMDSRGLNEFVKQFYYLYTKEGLIIDVRYNGGGFVSQLVLDRLRRIVVGMGAGRFEGISTYPGTAFHGHMACLLNEFSCSDGDIFPFYFREYGLGPLIGKRSWGGVIGIGGSRPLVDGGIVFVPGGGSYDMQSSWVMENIGVEPDIEIDQEPKLVMQGRDPQLEKAIEVVMEKIKNEPKKLPAKPGPPKQ